jgi:hypothetical protein
VSGATLASSRAGGCGIFVLKSVGLAGEITIKMIKRTSSTSIKGVTLMAGFILFTNFSPFQF